jgi:hypothetical protein
MTWFQIYASVGAPIVLIALSYGLMAYHRWDRNRAEHAEAARAQSTARHA